MIKSVFFNQSSEFWNILGYTKNFNSISESLKVFSDFMYQNTNYNILCCNINKKITISRCVHVFVEVSTSKDGGKKIS